MQKREVKIMKDLFESVRKEAREQGIRKIVVASSTGESAKRTVEQLGTKEYEIIVVTDRAENCWDVTSLSKRARKDFKIKKGEKERKSGISYESLTHKELKKMGIKRVIQATEVFRGINVPGGCNVAQVIAHALYLFGAGTKVAVEISLIACDAGAVKAGEDVIAIAGRNKGLNTALLITAAHTDEFFGIGLPEAKKPIKRLRIKKVIYKMD